MPSPNQLIVSLPYFVDSAKLFSVCADQAWAVFLDSGFPGSHQGRYDIIAADPICTLVTHGEVTEITCNGVTTKSIENPCLSQINQSSRHMPCKPCFRLQYAC